MNGFDKDKSHNKGSLDFLVIIVYSTTSSFDAYQV